MGYMPKKHLAPHNRSHVITAYHALKDMDRNNSASSWVKLQKHEEFQLFSHVTDSMDMNLNKLGEIVKEIVACCNPWGCKQSDMT